MTNVIPPRASFLGLPTELRLVIYEHLLEDSVTVHFSPLRPRYPYGVAPHVDGKLCTCPHKQFSQLCTRPNFSPLYTDDEKCLQRHTKLDGIFTIRKVCRRIRMEIRGVFEPGRLNRITSLSTSSLWRSEIPYNTDLSILRRLTLQGNVHDRAFRNQITGSLKSSAAKLHSLHTIAVQGPTQHYKFNVKRRKQSASFNPETTWRQSFMIQALESMLPGRVTVVLEAWMMVKAGHSRNQIKCGSSSAELIIFTGVVWGIKDPDVINQERKASTQVERRHIKIDHDSAEWKSYWKGEGMIYASAGSNRIRESEKKSTWVPPVNST